MRLDAWLLFIKYLINAGIFTAKCGDKLPDQKDAGFCCSKAWKQHPVFHSSDVRDTLGF